MADLHRSCICCLSSYRSVRSRLLSVLQIDQADLNFKVCERMLQMRVWQEFASHSASKLHFGDSSASISQSDTVCLYPGIKTATECFTSTFSHFYVFVAQFSLRFIFLTSLPALIWVIYRFRHAWSHFLHTGQNYVISPVNGAQKF